MLSSGSGLDPLALTAAWQVLAGAFAWVLHSMCLGGLVMRGGRRDHGLQAPNPTLQLFFACSLGMATNILALQALAFAGGFNRAWILAWAGCSIAAGWMQRPRATVPRAWAERSELGLAGFLAMVLLAVVTWGAARAPGHWDDTMYHLPLAMSYIEHGGIALSPHLRFPLFPQNMNLVQGLGLLFGDVRLAQALSTVPLGLSLLGLVGASQWLLGARLWGLLAGLLLWLNTPVTQTWGFAYVDNGLALFCWAATLALAVGKPQAPGQRWHPSWVTAAAVLAATAAGTKYFGAVFAVLLGLLLLPSALKDRAFLRYAAVGTLLGSAWYLRSFWVSGDPLHPAGGTVFGHFLWSAEDLRNQQAEQALFGVPRQPWRIFEALSVAGVGWWGLAVVGFWGVWRRDGPVRVFQWIGLPYLVFWFVVTQVERYLAPVHGVLSFLSVWALVSGCRELGRGLIRSGRFAGRLSRWPLDAVASSVLLAVVVVGVAPKLSNRAQQFADDLSKRKGYALMQRANTLKAVHGDQLTQLFLEQARFYFRGTVHGDAFGPARYWQAIRCRPDTGCEVAGPQALADFARRFGSRMVAVGTERLRIDLPAYQALFDVVMQTPDGVLLVLREP